MSPYIKDVRVVELPDSVGFTDVSKMLVAEDGSMIILDSRGVVSSLSADSGEGAKLPLECHATQDEVYFHVCGPQAADNAAIFSKSKGTGIRWVNSPEDGDVRILGTDKDYFYMVTTGVPESEESGPLAKFISLTLESNSVQEGKTCLLKFRVAL